MSILPAGSIFAGYRIEGMAGRGGMGVVYRARDLRLERLVALKLIAPEHSRDLTFRRRFERECRLAASLRHPNVVTIFHADEIDETLFITMEYIEGADLDRLIGDFERLEPARVARLLVQIGSALAAAHHRGMVHRDVKPANILVAEDGGSEQAYLTDFGLTKDVASDSSLTETGAFVGTLDYIAPEQISGDGVDGRSDVYSLGAVLFHALTGGVPFPQRGTAAKLYAHLHQPAPRPTEAISGLDTRWNLVVAKAMAKDPGERYATAAEFSDAVAAAALDSPRARPTNNGEDDDTWVPPPSAVSHTVMPPAEGFTQLPRSRAEVIEWFRHPRERRSVAIATHGRPLGRLRYSPAGGEAAADIGDQSLRLRWTSGSKASAIDPRSGATVAMYSRGLLRGGEVIRLAEGGQFTRRFVSDFRKHPWETVDEDGATRTVQVTHWLVADERGKTVVHLLQPTPQRGSPLRVLLKARVRGQVDDGALPLLVAISGFLLL